MPEPTTPIEPGALAKIIHDVPDAGYCRALRAGELIVIEDYVPADEAEDGTAYYEASTHETGNSYDVTVNVEHVELVKTAAQMGARRIPTVTELRDFLGSELLGDGEGFQVTETDRNGENGVEIAGRTDDGLRFAATIQITTIYEADF